MPSFLVLLLTLVATTLSITASFTAPEPGAYLEADDAQSSVTVVQRQQLLFWSSDVPVATVRVEGWPVDGDDELAGAVRLDRVDPDTSRAGIVHYSEFPQRVEFALASN